MKTQIKILVVAAMLLGIFSGISFAGGVSASKSLMTPATEMAKTLGEKVLVTVKLLDEFSSPVSGHFVRLISSSSDDIIVGKSRNGVTDFNGEISFEVVGGRNGVSTYSAYDSSSDIVINAKSRILFFESMSSLQTNKFTQANSFSSSLSGFSGNASGPVDHLKFENVPLSVTPGENISIKITAVDNNDQVVQNYTGKVRFSVSTANSTSVTLPQDYTFTLQDQGSHIFSLAMSFQQVGNYKVKITDLDNLEVIGEQAFVVQSADFNPSNGSGIILTSPSSGTVSGNVQVVSGTAPAAARLKIFDNEIAIGTVIADSAGKFSFTTGALAEGQHKIYVASVNEVDTIISTSPTVNLSIDLKAPEISKVEFEPSGAVDPASNVKVKLFVSDTLSQAKLSFNNNTFEMTKNPAGYYEMTVVAPIEFNEYPMSFTLIDELGNETNAKDYSKIQVGILGAKATAPVTVSNLVAKPGPNRVILNWNAANSLTSNVKNYRVFYGLSPNQLINAVDTLSGATTWYIPNLENGKAYYFAVAAVDDKGNTSTSFEQIVTATPGDSVAGGNVPDVEVINGVAGKEAIKDMKADVSESGPEIWWLVWLSALGGLGYGHFRKGANYRNF